MRVAQIMSQPPRTCGASDPMNIPAQMMWDDDLGCVIVVDDDKAPTGVITDRDICMAAYTQGKALADLPVVIGMAKVVHTCRAEDSISSALELMQKHQLHRLPVIDAKGRAVGLLSMSDILRAAEEADLFKAATTLVEIVKPRKARELTMRKSDALVAA